MTRAKLLLMPPVLLALAACDPYASPGPSASGGVRISGDAAVGIGSDGALSDRYGGSGPPPGRTPAEREARQKYYQGPRGNEF